MIRGFKAMKDYLFERAGVTIHPDTLRKAVKDESNPLPVEWDNGFAIIEPATLMAWRRKRLGRRRQKEAAA